MDDLNHLWLEDNWDVLLAEHTGFREEAATGKNNKHERGRWGSNSTGTGVGHVATNGFEILNMDQYKAKLKPTDGIVEFDSLDGVKSWTDDTRAVLGYIQARIGAIVAKRVRMAKRMARIAEEERELAAQERAERKAIARRAWEDSARAQSRENDVARKETETEKEKETSTLVKWSAVR